MPSTKVKFTNIGFKDIASQIGFCTHKMTVSSDNGHVTHEQGPSGYHYIKFKGAGAPLEISVTNAYTVLGIVFVQYVPSDSAKSDVDGGLNFSPPALLPSGAITVTNNFIMSLPATAGGVYYETYVAIKRNLDNAIGIIDPGIENEN